MRQFAAVYAAVCRKGCLVQTNFVSAIKITKEPVATGKRSQHCSYSIALRSLFTPFVFQR